MGLSKTVTQVYSTASLGANTESVLADCTATDLDKSVQLAVTVRCTYHASGTAKALVKIFTSADGTNYDTKELASFENDFAAGAAKQKTVYVNPDARYMKATVKNQDGTYAITTVSVNVSKADLS